MSDNKEKIEKKYLKIKKLQQEVKEIERIEKSKARKERTRKLIICGGAFIKLENINIDSLSIKEVENLMKEKLSRGTN